MAGAFEQYIGSTTTDFRVRFRNHKSAMITKKKTCEVAVHFNETPHDLSDFSFQCIDQVQVTADNSTNTENVLITKEGYWNAQLFSLAPFGLNKRQEFHSKKRITETIVSVKINSKFRGHSNIYTTQPPAIVCLKLSVG